jgi:acyl-homoserine lactone synthase
MFHVVEKSNRERFMRQLASMHEHRPEMFEGRPGGGPEAAAGRWGKDRFDDEHAVYVMSLDSWGEIECCVRLRPATQGSIIGSFYRAGIEAGERPPEDAKTWEMSHYYARGGGRGETGWRQRAQMRLATLAAANEAGADRIISVCETSFWPAAERCGWRARRIGPAFAYCDGGEALIYEVDASPEGLEAFRRFLAAERQPKGARRDAREIAAMAEKLGPRGLDLVSSVSRRIAEVEEASGADAAMALAEKLSRVVPGAPRDS